MHVIVLVKQVPDVANIPDDAWDREKGTLRRALLDSILNPLDHHALSFAARITAGDPAARTVYLTMGPPQARDVLVDCLSRAPGEGVLLTDRAMGGADTVATAYSLAQAIRRIERELLGGSRDYVVVAGMQSVDGDTAQVPPQIAEELGIDQVAYVQDARFEDGRMTFRRIGPGGTEDVTPLRFPTLVTITACTEPLFQGFAAARAARHAEVHTWSAADIEADPARVGAKGSRTTVFRIFSPSEDRAKTCEFLADPRDLVPVLLRRYGAAAVPTDATDAGYELGDREPTYRGAFWVVAERDGDAIKSVSLELLGKARELADALGEEVAAVLPCDAAGDLPRSLIAAGADTVYAIEHPALAAFNPVAWKAAIAPLVRAEHPQVVLFGATPMGRELAPRVAYACDAGLTADCTRLDVGDHAKGGRDLVGILLQTRPALGGNIMATIMTKDSPTQMASVRPGVFPAPAPAARDGRVVNVTPELGDSADGLAIVPVESFAAIESIRDAAILVAGGHGIRNRAAWDTLLPPLAEGLERLLGDPAKVAASRHAVEDGYTNHDHQVGQTGQTVAPRLYVAAGISGAVQHISGMQGAELIVAINKDPRARIFNYADYGIVGDLETIVPALARAISEAN